MSTPTITMPGLQTGNPETLLAYANAAYGLYQTLKRLNPKETDASPSSPDHQDHLTALAADVLTVGARILDFENAISKHDVRFAALERRLDPSTGAKPASEGEQNTCAHIWSTVNVYAVGQNVGDPQPFVGCYARCSACGEMRKRL